MPLNLVPKMKSFTKSSCSGRNHTILLLMLVAEKVLLLLVISLTVYKPDSVSVIALLADNFPDSKVYGANMGPIWDRQDPGGPHVGPMNFAFWVGTERCWAICSSYDNVRNISPRVSAYSSDSGTHLTTLTTCHNIKWLTWSREMSRPFEPNKHMILCSFSVCFRICVHLSMHDL